MKNTLADELYYNDSTLVDYKIFRQQKNEAIKCISMQVDGSMEKNETIKSNICFSNL